MNRKPYPSDLTDAEWNILEPLIPPAKPGGHPRTTKIREVLNAIFYLVRNGCAWRALPHDFPCWSTVWTYFRTWRLAGLWETIHTTLREAVRVSEGREPAPVQPFLRVNRSRLASKEESGAMMVLRSSADASAIWSWIPLD